MARFRGTGPLFYVGGYDLNLRPPGYEAQRATELLHPASVCSNTIHEMRAAQIEKPNTDLRREETKRPVSQDLEPGRSLQ